MYVHSLSVARQLKGSITPVLVGVSNDFAALVRGGRGGGVKSRSLTNPLNIDHPTSHPLRRRASHLPVGGRSYQPTEKNDNNFRTRCKFSQTS